MLELLPFPKGHHHALSEVNGVVRGELGKPFQAFPFLKIFDYVPIGFDNNDRLLVKSQDSHAIGRDDLRHTRSC